jgi:hypothetical protein
MLLFSCIYLSNDLEIEKRIVPRTENRRNGNGNRSWILGSISFWVFRRHSFHDHFPLRHQNRQTGKETLRTAVILLCSYPLPCPLDHLPHPYHYPFLFIG